MGNSSRLSVKVNESLAQAAGSFMWSLGLVQRIMFQSLPWSVKEEKEIRISGELIYCLFLFLFLLLESPGWETTVLSVSLAVAPLLNIMEKYYYLSWCSGSGWDGVNLCSNLYSAMFWTCNHNSVVYMPVFQLWLYSACRIKALIFLTLPLPLQRAG